VPGPTRIFVVFFTIYILHISRTGPRHRRGRRQATRRPPRSPSGVRALTRQRTFFCRISIHFIRPDVAHTGPQGCPCCSSLASCGLTFPSQVVWDLVNGRSEHKTVGREPWIWMLSFHVVLPVSPTATLPLGDKTAGRRTGTSPALHTPGLFGRWRADAGWVARTYHPDAPRQ
jgi:hypothetical protein